MILHPPESTLTDTLVPLTTLLRSWVSVVATPFSSTSSTRTDSDASAAGVDSHTSASIGPLMYMSSASGAVWYFTLRTSLVLLFSKIGRASCRERVCQYV